MSGWVVFSLYLFLTTVNLRLALAAPVPLLKVDSPIDGQVLESYVVNLKFSLKNFSLKDPRQLLKNNPNQGHLRLWLDKEENTAANATKYYRTDSYAFADVLPGQHTLVIELANNDQSSFDPQIKQTIKFETRAPPGSEAAPVKNEDKAKVFATQAGESPLSAAASAPAGLNYFLFAGVALILGLAGVFLLRR